MSRVEALCPRPWCLSHHAPWPPCVGRALLRLPPSRDKVETSAFTILQRTQVGARRSVPPQRGMSRLYSLKARTACSTAFECSPVSYYHSLGADIARPVQAMRPLSAPRRQDRRAIQPAPASLISTSRVTAPNRLESPLLVLGMGTRGRNNATAPAEVRCHTSARPSRSLTCPGAPSRQPSHLPSCVLPHLPPSAVFRKTPLRRREACKDSQKDVLAR